MYKFFVLDHRLTNKNTQWADRLNAHTFYNLSINCYGDPIKELQPYQKISFVDSWQYLAFHLCDEDYSELAKNNGWFVFLTGGTFLPTSPMAARKCLDYLPKVFQRELRNDIHGIFHFLNKETTTYHPQFFAIKAKTWVDNQNIARTLYQNFGDRTYERYVSDECVHDDYTPVFINTRKTKNSSLQELKVLKRWINFPLMVMLESKKKLINVSEGLRSIKRFQYTDSDEKEQETTELFLEDKKPSRLNRFYNNEYTTIYNYPTDAPRAPVLNSDKVLIVTPFSGDLNNSLLSSFLKTNKNAFVLRYDINQEAINYYHSNTENDEIEKMKTSERYHFIKIDIIKDHNRFSRIISKICKRHDIKSIFLNVTNIPTFGLNIANGVDMNLNSIRFIKKNLSKNFDVIISGETPYAYSNSEIIDTLLDNYNSRKLMCKMYIPTSRYEIITENNTSVGYPLVRKIENDNHYQIFDIEFPWQDFLIECENVHFFEHRNHPGWKSVALHGIAPNETKSSNSSMSFHDIGAPKILQYFQDIGPERFGYKKFGRVRIMLLEPGGFIGFHRDNDRFGYVRGNPGPINMAINHPEGCHFYSWSGKEANNKNTFCEMPFAPGVALKINISQVHCVLNNSNENRYHIIVHGS